MRNADLLLSKKSLTESEIKKSLKKITDI